MANYSVTTWADMIYRNESIYCRNESSYYDTWEEAKKAFEKALSEAIQRATENRQYISHRVVKKGKEFIMVDVVLENRLTIYSESYRVCKL